MPFPNRVVGMAAKGAQLAGDIFKKSFRNRNKHRSNLKSVGKENFLNYFLKLDKNIYNN